MKAQLSTKTVQRTPFSCSFTFFVFMRSQANTIEFFNFFTNVNVHDQKFSATNKRERIYLIFYDRERTQTNFWFFFTNANKQERKVSTRIFIKILILKRKTPTVENIIEIWDRRSFHLQQTMRIKFQWNGFF